MKGCTIFSIIIWATHTYIHHLKNNTNASMQLTMLLHFSCNGLCMWWIDVQYVNMILEQQIVCMYVCMYVCMHVWVWYPLCERVLDLVSLDDFILAQYFHRVHLMVRRRQWTNQIHLAETNRITSIQYGHRCIYIHDGAANLPFPSTLISWKSFTVAILSPIDCFISGVELCRPNIFSDVRLPERSETWFSTSKKIAS